MKDWQERRDRLSQGLHAVFIAPLSLGVPVARLRALAEFLSIQLIASTVDSSREH